MNMTKRRKLEKTINEWCRANQAKPRKQSTPLGERYEVEWSKAEEPMIVRFIDIYPRDENRVIVQKGIAERNTDLRATGAIYNRTIDQIYVTLDELKPFTDQLSREYLDDAASPHVASRAPYSGAKVRNRHP